MKVTSYSQFKYIRADHTTSIEEIKRQYKALALRLHPDMGGSNEAMAQLNVEFDFCKCHNFNVHKAQSGSVYTDQTQERPDDVTERYAEIIDQLIHMEGIVIEICGSFIWLSGDTKPHKEEIKALGFRWASRKKMWYLAPKGWRKKGRRELTMGEIRDTYGSVKVAATSRLQLTA